MKLIATMIAALGVSMTGGATEAGPSAMTLNVGAAKAGSDRAVEFRSKSYTAPDAMLVQVDGGTTLKRVQRNGKWVWLANPGSDDDSGSNSNSNSNSNSSSNGNSDSNSNSNSDDDSDD
jgi:hypothetical protein